MSYLRLGVNLDHVATLRNARGEGHPDPVRAAKVALAGGADGITVHLREDRRHIRDEDVRRLRDEIPAPLNFEMAASQEMLAIAREIGPASVCIVPERRQEITTEGGLDAAAQAEALTPMVTALKQIGARISLFVEPEQRQLEAARAVGADAVELHTGRYSNLTDQEQIQELRRIEAAAEAGQALGLEIHAGHGLRFDNVAGIAAIAPIRELNIGHFLVGEALFCGLEAAVTRMRQIMTRARETVGAA